MCLAACILGLAQWRHGRSRDETKYYRPLFLFSHYSLEDFDWDTTAPNYIAETRLDGEAPVNRGGCFVGRLRGYFVPPRDGDYRFLIHSDDDSQLFMSTTGDSTNMVCFNQSLLSSFLLEFVRFLILYGFRFQNTRIIYRIISNTIPTYSMPNLENDCIDLDPIRL